MKREIEDVDGARMEKLVDRYRETIETELRGMVEELGGECRSVVVQLDEELEGGTFGRVMAVEMTVSEAEVIRELTSRIGVYYGVKEGNIAIYLETE